MENGEAPATKRDIDQPRSEMSHIHDDLVERIRDGETRLLNAFYGFVQSNVKRVAEF
ncbi:MAG: hypothetical protein ABSB35_34110 [Bryobacteraceae bacterium]|jgi:hypothetical protein